MIIYFHKCGPESSKWALSKTSLFWDAKMRSLCYIQVSTISTAYIQTRGGRLFVDYASPKGTELLFVKAKPKPNWRVRNSYKTPAWKSNSNSSREKDIEWVSWGCPEYFFIWKGNHHSYQNTCAHSHTYQNTCTHSHTHTHFECS